MEERKVLNYPVRVAAMVWGFESTGSHKGSSQALPVGIPQRTFLPSCALAVPAGLPRAAPPSQPLPCGVEARAVLGPGRCKAFSSGFYHAFFSPIKFLPVLCDPL